MVIQEPASADFTRTMLTPVPMLTRMNGKRGRGSDSGERTYDLGQRTAVQTSNVSLNRTQKKERMKVKHFSTTKTQRLNDETIEIVKLMYGRSLVFVMTFMVKC